VKTEAEVFRKVEGSNEWSGFRLRERWISFLNANKGSLYYKVKI